MLGSVKFAVAPPGLDTYAVKPAPTKVPRPLWYTLTHDVGALNVRVVVASYVTFCVVVDPPPSLRPY